MVSMEDIPEYINLRAQQCNVPYVREKVSQRQSEQSNTRPNTFVWPKQNTNRKWSGLITYPIPYENMNLLVH
jgi:hypothetical protein